MILHCIESLRLQGNSWFKNMNFFSELEMLLKSFVRMMESTVEEESVRYECNLW